MVVLLSSLSLVQISDYVSAGAAAAEIMISLMEW
jgi:hypothetical protein